MAESWIGGDIAGIQSMGHILTSAREDLDGAVKPLSSQADTLVGDAGWQGAAAEEFRGRWSEDAITAGGFADLVGEVGAVLTELGNQLSAADSALYNAAHAAQGRGVSLGPTGAPVPLVTADPPTATDQKAISELTGYSEIYDRIVQVAQQARLDAAGKLQRLFDDINPDGPMKLADKATVAAFLRDLYGSKDDYRTNAAEEAQTKLDSASKQTQTAAEALISEQQKLKAAGLEIPKDLPQDAAYRQAIQQFKALNGELETAEASRSVFDRTLNYKLADAAEDLKLFEGVEKLPEFLRDVPVVDIAAAAVVTGAEAQEDHDKGWSWTHSVIVDGGAAVGGLVAGAAIVASVPEDLEGVGLAASYAATAVPVVVAAVGIDKAFHEHWREDMHDHGFFGGLYDGGKNVATGTGKSIWGDVKGIGHGISNLL